MSNELKTNSVFVFVDGTLTIKVSGHGRANGWGEFAFHEGQIEWSDGGYALVEIPPSELDALRDFLNKLPARALLAEQREAQS